MPLCNVLIDMIILKVISSILIRLKLERGNASTKMCNLYINFVWFIA